MTRFSMRTFAATPPALASLSSKTSACFTRFPFFFLSNWASDFEPRNDLKVFSTWNPEHDFYGQIFISAYFLNTPNPFRGSSTISNWRLQYLFHWCVHWMNNSPEPFPLVIPEDGKNLWLKYTHGADSTRSASFSLIPLIFCDVYNGNVSITDPQKLEDRKQFFFFCVCLFLFCVSRWLKFTPGKKSTFEIFSSNSTSLARKGR